MSKILVVDDDPVQLRLTCAVAEKGGFEPISATGGEEALTLLRDKRSISAVILDLVMPDLDGMGVMEIMAREHITCPVIIQTASSSLETVISAMRQGAVDFFVKPVAPERLLISLRNALKMGELETCVQLEKQRHARRLQLTEIISESPAMDRVFDLATKAAKSNIPVLLEGETGVGKEILARAIQGSSDRAGKPFVIVNCAAIPTNLIESTLFGHVKGAFTGAIANHAGKFAEANNGTLFLDEVGELPPEAQVKLLRVIQEGEFEPVGSNKVQKTNVRLISATNRRLLNHTKDGHFREDLYYRLNVFPIYIPPLRDRVEDISALSDHFIAKLGPEAGRRVLGLSQSATQLLASFDWPGNVRQLENAIYRAMVLTESATLQAVDFPQINAAIRGKSETGQQIADATTIRSPTHIDDLPARADPADTDGGPIAQQTASQHFAAPSAIHAELVETDRFTDENGSVLPLAEVERALIIFTLEQHKHKMTSVARALGIGRSTLYRKLKEYDLEPQSGAQHTHNAAA